MKKWIFVGVTVTILSIIASGIFFPNLYEDELKDLLEQQVSLQTDSTYSAELNKLNISFWKREITADSLVIKPSNDQEPIKSVSAGSISIEGIQWWSLLTHDLAKFGTIVIENPYIEVYSRPLESSTFSQTKQDSSFSDKMDIPIFNFRIENGKARLVEPTGRTEVMIEKFNLMATKVDIAQILDGSRLPFLDELILSGNGLTWRLDEKLYRFEVGEFGFDRVNKRAEVKDLALIPVLEEYEFSRIKGYSTDRIDISIDRVSFEDLLLDSLYIPRIQLGKLLVEKGDIYVFKNKTIPPKSTIGYRDLFAQISKEAGIQLGIDEIAISDLNVSYKEHKEGADSAGMIFFENINGSVLDVNTLGYPEHATDTMKLRVKTKFMGTSDLSLNVDYPLFTKNEFHTVQGSLNKLETSTVSDPLLHLAFVEIKSGIINSMDFDFTVTDRKAEGKLLLDYEDLKLTFLNSDDPDDKNLGTRLKTFVANTVGLNTDHTGDIDSKEIDYEWDKRKGVFGYWWRSLLTGIKNTIQ